MTGTQILWRRWAPEILLALEAGPQRFNRLLTLKRDWLISDRVLTVRLRELEDGGLVTRQVDVGPPVRVSYALTMAGRLRAAKSPAYQNDGDPRTSGPGFALTLHPDRLEAPLHWPKPSLVFVNSMSDLFHAKVPFNFVEKVWDVMRRSPQHTYQILTKRPDRMARFSERLEVLPNVWLGTSIEDQARLARLRDLNFTLAPVPFLTPNPPF